MAHLATPEFAGAFLITCVAAMLQGTIGFGFAMLSVPLLLLLNPLFAPVPQLFVVLPLTLAMVRRERHAIELRSTMWILGGRVPGALLGVTLLKLASTRTLDITIALMVLFAVAVVVVHRGFARTPAREFGAGVASGTMGMVSSIGGPPVALLYRNDEGPTVRANLALVFAIGVCITIGVRTAAGEVQAAEVVIGAALIPAMLLGLFGSRYVIPHVDGERLSHAIVVVAAAVAVLLLLRSW